MDNPTLRKGLDAITSSLNQLGDTFEKAFEVTLSYLLKFQNWFLLNSSHYVIVDEFLWREIPVSTFNRFIS